VFNSSEKTSRLKFAVEAVEMRLKVFQPLFQPLQLISEINRKFNPSTVILCFMPPGYQDHHVM
jgi:hypothetical protein